MDPLSIQRVGVQGVDLERNDRGAAGPERAAKPPGVPFAEQIGAALRQANQALNEADASAAAVAKGEGDVVDAMVAMGRADISLRLVLSMRNKLLEAYQEVMRLQL